MRKAKGLRKGRCEERGVLSVSLLAISRDTSALAVPPQQSRIRALDGRINQCRALRDTIPPTPPGPEGSNGNGLVWAQ